MRGLYSYRRVTFDICITSSNLPKLGFLSQDTEGWLRMLIFFRPVWNSVLKALLKVRVIPSLLHWIGKLPAFLWLLPSTGGEATMPFISILNNANIMYVSYSTHNYPMLV